MDIAFYINVIYIISLFHKKECCAVPIWIIAGEQYSYFDVIFLIPRLPLCENRQSSFIALRKNEKLVFCCFFTTGKR
jgi:hypothetical protein